MDAVTVPVVATVFMLVTVSAVAAAKVKPAEPETVTVLSAVKSLVKETAFVPATVNVSTVALVSAVEEFLVAVVMFSVFSAVAVSVTAPVTSLSVKPSVAALVVTAAPPAPLFARDKVVKALRLLVPPRAALAP